MFHKFFIFRFDYGDVQCPGDSVFTCTGRTDDELPVCSYRPSAGVYAGAVQDMQVPTQPINTNGACSSQKKGSVRFSCKDCNSVAWYKKPYYCLPAPNCNNAGNAAECPSNNGLICGDLDTAECNGKPICNDYDSSEFSPIPAQPVCSFYDNADQNAIPPSEMCNDFNLHCPAIDPPECQDEKALCRRGVLTCDQKHRHLNSFKPVCSLVPNVVKLNPKYACYKSAANEVATAGFKKFKPHLHSWNVQDTFKFNCKEVVEPAVCGPAHAIDSGGHGWYVCPRGATLTCHGYDKPQCSFELDVKGARGFFIDDYGTGTSFYDMGNDQETYWKCPKSCEEIRKMEQEEEWKKYFGNGQYGYEGYHKGR